MFHQNSVHKIRYRRKIVQNLGFSTKSQFLEFYSKILIEHIESKVSLDLMLQIDLIFYIRNRSRDRDLAEKRKDKKVFADILASRTNSYGTYRVKNQLRFSATNRVQNFARTHRRTMKNRLKKDQIIIEIYLQSFSVFFLQSSSKNDQQNLLYVPITQGP